MRYVPELPGRTFAKIALAFALAASAFLASETASFAQGAPAAPPVTQSHPSGSWLVRCYRMQNANCDMTQIAYVKGRNVRIASIGIAYIPKSNAYVGRFVLPLGVAFDPGMTLEIGSFKAPNLKYRRCERDGCYVEGVLPASMIEAFQAPGVDKGAMDIVFVDGRKFQIPISLDGFGDAVDMLRKWSAGDKPASDKPASDKPAPDKPAAPKPGRKMPAAADSSTDN